jgi:Uma2 family endonuclease
MLEAVDRSAFLTLPMSLALRVTTADGKEFPGPYLLRVGGWTEERYFAEAPESQIVEFEDGDLIVPSPVNIHHQDLVGFVSFLLRGYVSARGLGRVLNGPAVVRLRPGLDYEPDIFVVLTEQSGQLGKQYLSGGPAFVAEVISPGGRSYDLHSKADNYRRYGVREYWAIDPETRTLRQHRLADENESPWLVTEYVSGRVNSAVLAGFWIDASWLWQEPLPEGLSLLEALLRS